jgi:hypothetical protein
MKPNIKKFSLFLEHNNGNGVVDWEMSPLPVQILTHNNVIEYQYEFDLKKINIVKISVTNRTGSNSYIRVHDMRYNGIMLENIDAYSIFKTLNGTIKPFGYLDQIGDFYLKIRGDPLTLNYISYLLALTRENKSV